MTTTIYIDHGSEGPRHDPYSYEEITVERDGVRTTAHLGLGCWVKQVTPETRRNPYITQLADHKQVDLEMAALCGLTATMATRILRRIDEAKLREHRSHGGMEWSAGYPGENLLWCKCGAVVDSTFNRSAIE